MSGTAQKYSKKLGSQYFDYLDNEGIKGKIGTKKGLLRHFSFWIPLRLNIHIVTNERININKFLALHLSDDIFRPCH